MVATGTRLGPYEVLAPLGAGGMGEVYRARDSRLGRDVAFKILPEAVARDPERVARFDREARSLAALSHPALLALHDVGREGDVAYAVTELLEGETLPERVTRERLPWRKAVEIASSGRTSTPARSTTSSTSRRRWRGRSSPRSSCGRRSTLDSFDLTN